jgi:hypothetical protein
LEINPLRFQPPCIARGGSFIFHTQLLEKATWQGFFPNSSVRADGMEAFDKILDQSLDNMINDTLNKMQKKEQVDTPRSQPYIVRDYFQPPPRAR